MTAVTIASDKVRLVVGLLRNAGELGGALADLGDGLLRQDQIRVVGQADALGGALASWSRAGDARRFKAWVVCRPAEGTVPWELSTYGTDQCGTAERDAHTLLGLHQWSLRKPAQQLDHHLRTGGALLLIEPCTDTQEREACTVLLRHASGGIQTHEIGRLHPPRACSGP
jgi:hypothetical protein